MAYRKTTSQNSTAPAIDSNITPAQSEDVQVNPPDNHIWGVYGMIVFLSIVELYSASSFEISKQGLYSPLIRHVGFLFIGFLMILGLQRVHYRFFRPMSKLLWWLSAIAMVYVMFFGQYVNGARRALPLGFMSLQPAEFIKISTALMIAVILSGTQLKKSAGLRNRGIVLTALLVLTSGGLLFTQGLTNTLLLMSISVSIMLIGAIEWRKFLIVIGVYALFGVGAMAVKMAMTDNDEDKSPALELFDSKGNRYVIPDAHDAGSGESSRISDGTWSGRMKAWLGDSIPKYEQPLTQRNLQEMRSYMAQARGGVTGVFPGNSRETARLPLAFSDYIYAIIVEDLGLIGGLAIMVLYLWLLARAYYIAAKCREAFPAFLVTGMAVMIAFQALCHMAIVSGAGPVSGQPLPLFSKGGTSILVNSLAIGIMLSVSRYAVRDDKIN